ncbi:CBS domain-containing protein [Thiohalobacter thiocyanaticus]|uniref:CBS domain-containing protein n=1 Tax=Thiohalobacter thiocyanaticus TaxID=585455 RepID=A0A426QL26_9GAMM|nr:CBS domain-containing protein [Thiohalobacter thiocyanaticus]RRQ22439.1 CBS domain-containing protein [Thiohalobacter thiocyanaticus]
MQTPYPPLEARRLSGPVTFFTPSQALPEEVSLESPAIFCMTDLRVVPALTIEPQVSIEWALGRMIDAGVRLLLVINADNQILGLITSHDIQGEKPLRLEHELGVRYAEIRVRDVMTPLELLDVIPVQDVLNATVGQVVSTLRQSGRHHALVTDALPTGQEAIRGIFSTTTISRQLGWQIQPTHQAGSFAELEVALNH